MPSIHVLHTAFTLATFCSANKHVRYKCCTLHYNIYTDFTLQLQGRQLWILWDRPNFHFCTFISALIPECISEPSLQKQLHDCFCKSNFIPQNLFINRLTFRLQPLCVVIFMIAACLSTESVAQYCITAPRNNSDQRNCSGKRHKFL